MRARRLPRNGVPRESPEASRFVHPHALHVLGGLLGVLLVLPGTWFALRSLVALGVPRLLPPLPCLSLEFALVVLTLLLLGSLARLIHYWRSGDPFARFSEAFSRIARGDFDAAVDLPRNAGPRGLERFADEINDMARSLKRMEALRQEFIATVSHDFQSPLTSILGFSRALRREDLDEATRTHYLDIIASESTRLSRLSADLLRLTALESQEQAPDPGPCDLARQLRAGVLSLEPQWRPKDLELDLRLEPVTVQADADLLAQVWMNLLHNACKFSFPGGRLTVSLRARAGGAEVKVSDAGAGIPAADLPHVFERFFKGDRARSAASPEYSGSGLGLAIAHRIVTLHGGTLQVESPGEGQGTTFTVTLPG